MTSLPILTVKNLNVYYGAIHALKGISFDVPEGKIISLIGCNGAGKSTTLRAISGLVTYSGEIYLKGSPLDTTPPHLRVGLGIGHSPEGRGIFGNMSVTENLELGAFLRRDKSDIKQDIENCFQLFPRLKERSKQIAGTLSGGEQQMLAISRSLMTKPKILLLDEPSMGLAPLIVSQIFQIIQNLNKMGITILLVEQNARLALKISDYAYVIETGKLVMEGSGQSLLGNPEVQSAYLGV